MAKSEFFANLNEDSTQRVSACLKRVKYSAGDLICCEDQPGDSMFFIVTGEVIVEKDMGWGQRELDRFGEGDMFGEMALISGEKRTATVRALTDTECLRLHNDDFDRLLDEDAHLAQRVARILSTRLATSNQESSQDLLGAYRALMFALADLAEYRDPQTGAHLERTRGYCTLMADLLSSHPNYREQIDSAFVDGIHYVSPLHDIGKVAIRDNVLLKPGKLDDEEYEVMKTHTTTGAGSLTRAIAASDQEIFPMAQRICLYHHERWDGKGYPEGLAGDEIPLEARIMAIADVFDALMSKRVYKPAFTFEETVDILQKGGGTQFDPLMIEVFVKHKDRFRDIYRKYSDS